MEPNTGGHRKYVELHRDGHQPDRNGSGQLTQGLAAYTGGFWRRGHVRRILELSGWSLTVRPSRAEAVAVWGRRPVSWRGLQVAGRTGLPVLNVEDAFLRSIRPGPGTPGMGLLLDTAGLHYDALAPSALEQHLASDRLTQTSRAAAGITFLRRHGISKYSDWDPDAPPPAPGYVLVIDQTAGDAAISAGGATPQSFRDMLAAARAEHPGQQIVLRTHPVTAAGRRAGHFGSLDLDAQTEICADPVNPWALLSGATAVYAVSSQMGFEAILAGHRPILFGQPFYAGWGLTDDRLPIPRRTRRLTAEQLFEAAMLTYPVWYDPYRDCITDFETVAQALADQARAWRENRNGAVCTGMKPWKHRPVAAFLNGRAGRPFFENNPDRAIALAKRTGRDLIVWAGKETRALRGAAQAKSVPLKRMEDGFLRSVGLGAELLPAASLVLDDLGIYFDPSRPSRLEALIASAELTAADRQRVEALVDRLIRARLTKYNVGATPDLPPLAPSQRRILVPGQVEDDASILRGAGVVRTNRDLLHRAREIFPDEQIVYKPHPDVEVGLRRGSVPEADLTAMADVVARQSSAAALLDQADVVVTMTSLMGFEGLLRGLEVHCLGRPFYGGWGLTEDHGQTFPRRHAKPDISALAHAALIGYPRYFDPVTRIACPAEVILDRLAERHPATARNPHRRHRWLAALQYRLRRFAPLWRR